MKPDDKLHISLTLNDVWPLLVLRPAVKDIKLYKYLHVCCKNRVLWSFPFIFPSIKVREGLPLQYYSTYFGFSVVRNISRIQNMGQFCNYYYYNFYTCSSGAPDVERSQDQQLDGQSEFWFGVQNFFLLQRLPQKSSAALHAADTNTRLLSLKTKEHNQ